MTKRASPTNILEARAAEARRKAEENEKANPDADKAVDDVFPVKGPIEEEGFESQIPYSLEDVFAALGQAQWNVMLLQRQVQQLRQQVITYRNLVSEYEGRLKEAGGAPR